MLVGEFIQPIERPGMAATNENLFNGIGGSQIYMGFIVAHRIGARAVPTQGKDSNREAIPVIVALIVAVVGTTGILMNDLGPGNGSRAGGSPGMISAAAVSRAGAIETPSEPSTDRSAY
jgi:hypothetical protein